MPSAPDGRELWLRAGQELLRAGGVTAVKLEALTARRGLTTGSFYHHFGGMADYLDQLAGYYGSDQPLGSLAVVDDPDPRARLRRLYALAREDRMGPLDAAMRDWALSNPRAAEAVRDADSILLRFVEQAFLDLGYRRREAQLRAQLLFAAGVARITLPWKPPPDPLDAVLGVLAP